MTAAILGPCPCHGCGRPVEWWRGLGWREDGARHVCEEVASNVRSTYTLEDGSSVKSHSIPLDTRPSATTRSAGVTASIGVVDR